MAVRRRQAPLTGAARWNNLSYARLAPRNGRRRKRTAPSGVPARRLGRRVERRPASSRHGERLGGTVPPDVEKTDLAGLEAELARYAEAIASGGSLDSILQAMRAREQRRAAIRTELKTLATNRQAEPHDASVIRARLRDYLQDWRSMARQSIAEARRLLRTVLVDRLVFTPDEAEELASTQRPWPAPEVRLRVQGRGDTL